MANDSLDAALERLDRAVARIEQAGRVIETPAQGLAEAYASLDERHGLLRLRVQETIERLDAMIDGEPVDVTRSVADEKAG